MPKKSDTPYGWKYVRRKKTKPGQPGTWNENKRLEVVSTFVATGSPTLTSKLTNVPMDTIKYWRKQEWWEDAIHEMQLKEDHEISAKLKNSMDKALDVVMDRLENGEYQYDSKTGRIVQVPVKLRDAQKVLSENMDKRLLLQKRPTKITESQNNVDDKLRTLAKEFAKFVTGKDHEDNVIDIVDEENIKYLENDNAVHEEWEEGLQSGTELGEVEQTQSSEGQSKA